MEPARTFRVRGDGIGIQVGEWPGEGETVLCLHGLTANLRCFDLVAAGLSPAHRVLALDLRGRGLSDKPPSGYSLDHHCQDLAAAMEDMGLAKVNLLGHSLGAYLCLAFAARHPELVARVVLLDGGGELSDSQWLKVGAGIQSAVDRLGKVFPSLDAYLAPVRQLPFFNPWNPSIEAYFRYEIEEVPGGVRSRVRPESIAEERANLRKVKPSALYPRVKCPALVVRATRGMLADGGLVLPEDATARMLEALPAARLVNLEGADHYSIIFQPNARRDRAMLEFLAG